jgi:dipeptidyl aminopeptidase/acylaminoacyl peptidase
VGYFVSIAFYSLVLSLLPSAAEAQTKRPMTFEDMMAMRRLGQTDVSPDGKWLLYSVTDVDLAKNAKINRIYIQEIAGGQPKIVETTQPGDDGARFAPDGKHILFLSSRNNTQQIFISEFDSVTGASSNQKDPLANGTSPMFTVQDATDNVTRPKLQFPEADNAIWSPDSKSIVFTAEVYPDCPAIVRNSDAAEKCNADRDAAKAASPVKAQIFTHLLYKHWNHFTGDKRNHLFLLDLATGQARDLTPNDPHDVPPFSLEGGCGCAISPDSKELTFTENLDEEPAISTNADIFTLDLTNSAAKPNKISTSAGGDFNPAYSPDGKYLAWRSQARANYESDKFRLLLYDRATKQTKDLLPNFAGWVDEFVWENTWTDGTQALLFVSGEKGAATPYQLNTKTNVVRRLGRSSGEWSDIHYVVWQGATIPGRLTHGFDAILASRMTIDQAPEVTVGDLTWMNDDNDKLLIRKANDPTDRGTHVAPYLPVPLTHLNDSILSQLDLAPLDAFWFEAADKTKVQGFLIKPPAFDPTKKYPVKFLIHGGPQGAWGDAWSYRWNAELLAADGYVVLMINPRGSTGYGQAFVDGVNGDWGGKPFTDLMTGLDYAEKTYPFIDKNRECALGASYGGYMANWILGHTNRFKCIVSHDGMFNPESAYGSTEELWFNEWEFKTPNTSGGKPWDYYGRPDSENPFRKWSPALSAKNFKTPTLVIHSQLDYRLDVSEGYQLFTTLQRLKVPSEMLYFPDEGHWVMKPQNSQLWYKTVNAWVDKWTKDRELGTGKRE